MNSILDYFNRKDKPSVVLLNPSLVHVASLGAAYNVVSTVRFSGISELSFSYPMSIDNGATKTEGYDNIKVKMIIELQGVGRYIISECPESSDGSTPIKNVAAQSLESELLYKRIVGLSGTFPFMDSPLTINSIMGKAVKQSNGWQVGIVDEELSGLYRTFDVGNNTVYNFLTSDVAKAFNCVFIFNTFLKTIDATLIKNLENHTGAFISLDTVSRSITINEYADEICTALNCYGGTNLDIRRVNPIGTNTIYNFSYYIQDEVNNWMTAELKTNLTSWRRKVIGAEQNYRDITLENNIAIEEYTVINQIVEEYQNTLDALQVTLEGLQAIPTTHEDDDTRAARLAEIDNTIIDIANMQIAIRKSRKDKADKRKEIDSRQANLRIITNSLKFTSEESWQALADSMVSIIEKFSKTASDWKAIIFETADDLEIDIPQFSSNIPSIEALIQDISSELELLYANISEKLVQYWYLDSNDKTGIAAHINIVVEKIINLCYMFDNLISNTDMTIDLRSDSKLLWSYASIICEDSNFTKEEYYELENFIFYNTYTNNNIIVTDIMTEEEIQQQAMILYDQSIEVLSRTSNPRYEIAGDFISIINAPEFIDLVKKLDLGMQVTVELPDGVRHVDVTLLEMSYNYDAPDSFAMTFSNRIKLNTSNFKFADMFLGITGGDNTGLSGITNGSESKTGAVSESQSLTGTNLLSVTNALISKLGFVSFGPTPPQKYGNYVGSWLGYDKGAKLSLYSSATDYLQWTGNKLLIKAKNFTLDSNGNITANNADLAGKITAASGDIGGWIIGANTLSAESGGIVLDSSVPKITLGNASNYMYGNGVFIGESSGSYVFRVGDPDNDYFAWTGSRIDISGDWIAGWDISENQLSSGSGDNYVTISSAGGDIPSFSAGGSPVGGAKFRVYNSGSLFATGATISGNITAEEGEIGGWSITSSSIVSPSNTAGITDGAYAFYAGSGAPSLAEFYVKTDGSLHATSASITGTIIANSGEIGGWEITDTSIEKGYIQLNSNSCRINVGDTVGGEGIIIDGPGGYIQSGNYFEDGAGFKIYNNGNAEFNNVHVRGELSTTVFKYDEVSAVAGTLGVYKSAGVLFSDATSASPASFNISLETLALNVYYFEISDILRIKSVDISEDDLGIYDNWMIITGSSSSYNSGSPIQTYTCQLKSGTPVTFGAGTAVLDYGQLNDGFLYMRATDTIAGSAVRPYYSVRTSGSEPWNDDFTEHVRLGSLTGALNTGLDLDGKYGIAIGNSGSYLTYDPTNGLIVKGNILADTGYLKDLAINGVLTLDTTGRLQQGVGDWEVDFTGTAIWSESDTMNIGGWNNNVKQWWGGSDGMLYAGNGAIILNNDGIAIRSAYGQEVLNPWVLKFQDIGYTDFVMAKIWAQKNYGLNQQNYLNIEADNDSTAYGSVITLHAKPYVGSFNSASLGLYAENGKGGTPSSISLEAFTINLRGDVKVGDDFEPKSLDVSGSLIVDGTIKDGSGVEYSKSTHIHDDLIYVQIYPNNKVIPASASNKTYVWVPPYFTGKTLKSIGMAVGTPASSGTRTVSIVTNAGTTVGSVSTTGTVYWAQNTSPSFTTVPVNGRYMISITNTDTTTTGLDVWFVLG